MVSPEKKASYTAAILVGLWLRGERRIQRVLEGNIPARLDTIMRFDLQATWNEFLTRRHMYQENPNATLYLEANQKLLKATAAARLAVVYNGLILGSGFDRADSASFRQFKDRFRRQSPDSLNLPDEARLDEPILGEAIAPASLTPIESQFQPLPVYLATAGLAITHLLAEQKQTGSMLLPCPGLPDWEIQPWSNR